MFLVDSHCHLDGLDYQTLHKNVDDVLAKAAARDVKFCLAVATTPSSAASARRVSTSQGSSWFNGCTPQEKTTLSRVPTSSRILR